MPLENDSIRELYSTLTSQYNIKSFVDLGDVTSSPQEIYQIFQKHYQASFEPNDRLVFYTSWEIPTSVLIHLYQAASLIDISNYFILLCSPYDISSMVTDTANNHSTDPVPFQTLTVPLLRNTGNLLENYVLPESVCPLPWMHLEVDNSGNIRPCCVFQGNFGNIDTQTLSDTFNSHDMIALRNEFLSGQKPRGCKICWNNEQQGLSSNRKYNVGLLKKSLMTEFLSEPKIASLDLKPGNACNFKCRICNPESSSLYADELSRVLKINPPAIKQWGNDDRCVEQLIALLPTLRNVDMYGGEPFLIKKFNSFLNSAIEQGHAKHIRLHYNTNGSVYPEHLIEYWKYFQHIDLQVSIDNVGPRFELERGGSWSKVEQNIKQLLKLNLPNLSISVMPAINIMNIFYIGELVDWASSLGLKVNPLYVHFPEEFSIKNLTRTAKNELIKKYQNHPWSELKNIITSINSYPDSDGSLFRDKTKYFDSVRQENFFETHPEIANAMGYVYNKNI
jgi:MoaA/NifB/PqqE/SkfB family radical SAM enzyme